jgi:hypothetical protein
VHVFSVPGVVSHNGTSTFFACTNAGAATVQIGVEVFGQDGSSGNDPSATSLGIGSGGTVLFGTTSANGINVDSNLGVTALSKGSARILATTARGILCTAFIADIAGTPPTSMTNLSIVKKATQQGD